MKQLLNLNIIFIMLSCMILSSCDSKKIKKATNALSEFEIAYKDQNSSAISKIYPAYSSIFGSHYKADTFSINEKKTEVSGDTVILSVTSSWTNPFGKEFKNNMTFILTPDEQNSDNYVISNSKGLFSLDEERLYRYALNKNPDIASMFDIEKSEATSAYYLEFINRVSAIKEAIKNNLYISNFNWHTGGYYTNYASGSAMVTNNYPIPLRNVKYKIEYYSKNPSNGGRLLAVDDGVVNYGDFPSGASKTFSWYTSNVGNASWASVECFIDDETFIEEIAVMAGGY